MGRTVMAAPAPPGQQGPRRISARLLGWIHRWPVLVQTAAWLLLWPLLAALFLAGAPRASRGRYLAAAAVLLAGTPLWVGALGDVPGVGAPIGAVADTLGRAVGRISPQGGSAGGTASVPGVQGPRPASPWQVVGVVDGDTLDVVSGDGVHETVRVIGIDTPERGDCGFTEASDALGAMVADRQVDLSPGAVDDRDRYGRLLRYVDVDGVDAGLSLIEQGLAIARYDSRDGYGHHPREETYVAADQATPHICASGDVQSQSRPAPQTGAGPGTGPGGAWASCSEAVAAGAAPVLRGDRGYGSHLDGDDDGVGCE